MWQSRQIRNHRRPAGVLTQGNRESPLARDFTKLGRLHDFSQMNFIGGWRRHLQTHQGLTGYRRFDAQVGCLQRQRQVLFPGQNALYLHPAFDPAVVFTAIAFLVSPARNQTEANDPRSRSNIFYLHDHAMLGQRGLYVAGHLQQWLLRLLPGCGRGQAFNGW